jgi:hypothetical protein
MYGVSADLPLEKFVGKECHSIIIGQFNIQFPFDDDLRICFECGWETCDASGSRIDRFQEHDDRSSYSVHKLLASPVDRYLIDAPRSFTLHFQNGFSLTIYDDDEHYETCQVSIGSSSIII